MSDMEKSKQGDSWYYGLRTSLDPIWGSPKYGIKPSPYLRKWQYCRMVESANVGEERTSFE